MPTPVISAVMPVYGDKYLEKAIKSVLAQTFADFELLLIDDCAPDKSGTICDSFALEDNRIRVIHLEKNGGVSRARNRGIKEAVGEYVIFIDGDDYIDDNLFEMVYTSANSNNADVVVFGIIEEYCDTNNQIYKTNPVFLEDGCFEGRQKLRKAVLRLEEATLYGYACNKLFRRSSLIKSGALYPVMAFNEDIIFNIDFFDNAEVLNILSACPYHYGKRAGSTTGKFIPTYYQDIMLKIERLYKQVEGWGMLDEYSLKLLAKEYVRRSFSAFERNFHKRSNMTGKERRAFFKKHIEGHLFKKLSPYMGGGSLAGIMAKTLKTKSCFLTLTLARIIFIVKKLFPKLFLRVAG